MTTRAEKRGPLDLRVRVVGREKDGIMILGLPMAELDPEEAEELILKLRAAVDAATLVQQYSGVPADPRTLNDDGYFVPVVRERSDNEGRG